MRAKKDRTGRQAIRYWLFADPKLQKLSLKKVSERGTKTAGAARRIRGKKATVAPAGPPASGSSTRRVLALAGFVLIVAAALALERQSVRSAEAPAPADEARDQAPVMTQPQIVPPVPAKPHATVPASSPSSTTRPPEKPSSAKVVSASAPAAAAKPVPAMLVTTPNPDPAAASAAEPTPTPVEPAPKPADSTITSATGAALVTVTGCLQQDEDLFWIKNASGAEAPRTRSWKSGFLRKRPTPIEIVGPISRLKLNDYVGRLVSATGTLEDRQMRPRSVREMAGSCQ